MSVCDYTCRQCIYFSQAGSFPCCNYLLVAGHRRGCPAGKGCERRIRGKRVPSIDALTFRAPPNMEKPKAEPKKPEGPKLSPREQKRQYMENWMKTCNGRQRAAILAYKDAHRLTTKILAYQIGVSKFTVSGWIQETRPADWEKLGKLGIRRPEGL
jgi:hypothetical protein